jgi:MFS transporter, ACS family, glucarate transporter
MLSADIPPPPLAARPTRVRYLVVGLSTLMAILLYLDRFCVSLAERYIKEDLGLSEAQVGYFFAMFFGAYALAQVPSGLLTDRIGARITLTIYILGWSFFTALTGLVQGFLVLLLIRGLFGLAQAGAYPTAASLISRWMPLSARGTASGITAFGGRIGGAIAPILTGLLIVMFVPTHESSRFEERDILDDPLFVRLALNQPPVPTAKSPQPEPPSGTSADLRAQLVAQWPEDVRGALARAGSRSPGERFTLDAAVRDGILSALNRQMDSAEQFSDESLLRLPLPQEAKSIHARRQAGGELTGEERARMNRLVLELVFPGALRQVYGRGWRPVMFIYGGLGVVVALVFWVLFRNTPGEHPACNDAERALIQGSSGPDAPREHSPFPWRSILRNRSLWLGSAVQFGTNVGWVFIVTWFPRYLSEVHQVPLIERAWMTSLPMFCGIAGNLLGGWLTDWTTMRWGLRRGRSLPVAITRFVCAGAFFGCLAVGTPWQATVLMCVVAVGTDLGSASLWAFAQDIGGRYVGSVLGWGNMFGNLGATVSPILLNAIIVSQFSWNGMFVVCGAVFGLVGVLAFGINGEDKVD